MIPMTHARLSQMFFSPPSGRGTFVWNFGALGARNGCVRLARVVESNRSIQVCVDFLDPLWIGKYRSRNCSESVGTLRIEPPGVETDEYDLCTALSLPARWFAGVPFVLTSGFLRF